ncbi:MAG: hypothetical protein J0651_05235 [Actinobacteria bacterium]|nr:hypothetical protein [Actinomycetota bacterium]
MSLLRWLSLQTLSEPELVQSFFGDGSLPENCTGNLVERGKWKELRAAYISAGGTSWKLTETKEAIGVLSKENESPLKQLPPAHDSAKLQDQGRPI